MQEAKSELSIIRTSGSRTHVKAYSKIRAEKSTDPYQICGKMQTAAQTEMTVTYQQTAAKTALTLNRICFQDVNSSTNSTKTYQNNVARCKQQLKQH